MFEIGLTELIIIILVLIIFFGSKRITQLAREAGKTTKELKKVKREYKKALEELQKEVDEDKTAKNITSE